jgi:hypothetical protein
MNEEIEVMCEATTEERLSAIEEWQAAMHLMVIDKLTERNATAKEHLATAKAQIVLSNKHLAALKRETFWLIFASGASVIVLVSCWVHNVLCN